MKRMVIIVIVAALGTLALTRVAPLPPLPPDFGTTLPPEPDGAVRSSSVWYCPWVKSGVDFESTFELATVPDVEASITLTRLHPGSGAKVSLAPRELRSAQDVRGLRQRGGAIERIRRPTPIAALETADREKEDAVEHHVALRVSVRHGRKKLDKLRAIAEFFVSQRAFEARVVR